MFRLVIVLPFNILLIHRHHFFSVESANAYIKENYSAFPAMEVWTQRKIEQHKGSSAVFPFNKPVAGEY
jgi:hypothetical protein